MTDRRRANAAPAWVQQAQNHWTNRGASRPSFAIAPGPGQESVWDYPRPPALVPDSREVVVAHQGVEIARSSHSLRLLETASPPTFYLPPQSVNHEALAPAPGNSMCEWKGPASYVGLAETPQDPIGWCYPSAWDPYADLAGWFSFYPGRIECRVGGEVVRPQPGHFYGGWITDDVVGPFKGDPGTSGW